MWHCFALNLGHIRATAAVNNRWISYLTLDLSPPRDEHIGWSIFSTLFSVCRQRHCFFPGQSSLLEVIDDNMLPGDTWPTSLSSVFRYPMQHLFAILSSLILCTCPSHLHRCSWTDSSNFSWPVCSGILSLRTMSFHDTFRILLSHLWCAASRRWVSGFVKGQVSAP